MLAALLAKTISAKLQYDRLSVKEADGVVIVCMKLHVNAQKQARRCAQANMHSAHWIVSVTRSKLFHNSD